MPAAQASHTCGPARRVSFSELLGGHLADVLCQVFSGSVVPSGMVTPLMSAPEATCS